MLIYRDVYAIIDNKYAYLFFHSSPFRIVDDCGGAFTMGIIGGGVFQAVKGFRNAPSVSYSS